MAMLDIEDDKNMRLSGWHRIGITVSFLWCIIIIGLSVCCFYETPSETFFTKQIEDASGKKLQATTDQGKPVTLVPLKCVPKYENIVGLMLVPVALGWFLIYSGVHTVK